MLTKIISIGKTASFTLKDGKIITGKIFDAACDWSWFKVLTDYGTWKVVKGSDIKSAAVV